MPPRLQARRRGPPPARTPEQHIVAAGRRRSAAPPWPARKRARPRYPASRQRSRKRPTGEMCYSCCPPKRLNSSANAGLSALPVQSGRRHPLERIEHEIGRLHLGQTAIGRLSADKAPVFGELVDRFAPAAHAEIGAALPAHLDTRLDVRKHLPEIGSPRQLDEGVAIDVPQKKIFVSRVLQPKQLGRKRRDVAGPIHAGDRKGLNQLVVERSVRGADNLLYCVLDFTNEGDLAGSGGGQSPEFAQKPIIGGLDPDFAERIGDMIPLGFLDIEAHLLDPLLDIEIEHLTGCGHTGCRQHRDHVKRNLMPAQQSDAGDSPVEGAPARAGQPVAVVKMLRAVDADPDTDPLVGEEPTPCLVDQGPVGLQRMRHYDFRGFQPIDHAERIAIEVDRQNHWLAGMPDDRQGFVDPARGEDLEEKIVQCLSRDDRLRVPIWKITITTIDVAERRGLDDQQIYPGHEAARRAIPRRPITNYAKNYSRGSNCANCSSWANPSAEDPSPRCATSFPRRDGDCRGRASPPARRPRKTPREWQPAVRRPRPPRRPKVASPADAHCRRSAPSRRARARRRRLRRVRCRTRS